MTTDKLNKARELSENIKQSKRDLISVKECSREIELTDGSCFIGEQSVVNVRVDRRECYINRDRLITFLKNEYDTKKIEFNELDTEFKNL